MRDKRTLGLSDQLYRALGAIGSDIAEGFSRKSGKDKARFYEYGLGSARESRDWYYKGRHVLRRKDSKSPYSSSHADNSPADYYDTAAARQYFA
ncbi:MAG: four helix bundle protein [Candidatus Poribacteria bacterium]